MNRAHFAVPIYHSDWGNNSLSKCWKFKTTTFNVLYTCIGFNMVKLGKLVRGEGLLVVYGMQRY